MSLNGDGPSVREPEDVTVVPGQMPGQVEVVDERVFIHAPQYHWHHEGGHDADARAAIERLHNDTYHFAQRTAQETQSRAGLFGKILGPGPDLTQVPARSRSRSSRS